MLIFNFAGRKKILFACINFCELSFTKRFAGIDFCESRFFVVDWLQPIVVELIQDYYTGLGLGKKYCFVKKIDNNVLSCARSARAIAM